MIHPTDTASTLTLSICLCSKNSARAYLIRRAFFFNSKERKKKSVSVRRQIETVDSNKTIEYKISRTTTWPVCAIYFSSLLAESKTTFQQPIQLYAGIRPTNLYIQFLVTSMCNDDNGDKSRFFFFLNFYSVCLVYSLLHRLSIVFLVAVVSRVRVSRKISVCVGGVPLRQRESVNLSRFWISRRIFISLADGITSVCVCGFMCVDFIA